MNAQEIIQAESNYVLNTYVRPEIVFTHGDGAYLYDTTGKRYLDFTSGIAVTALGHSDPQWVAAVKDQAGKLVHVSNLYHTEPHVELARRLVDNSFAAKVYFCNSGAEANEAAIKFARKFTKKIVAGKNETETISQLKNPTFSHELSPQKSQVVAFTGGFHGRTMGALATTYKAQYRQPFAPLMPGVIFTPYNDLEATSKVITDDTCAVIVEPIQGEGGINPATVEFLRGLRQLCNERHSLLIFDEVQCGLGRTGTLWAYENYNVTPDIMTLAKPLAGGLPIGATLVTQEVAEAIQPGDHGSTFAAGPLVCRAAEIVFHRVNQPHFLQQVQKNGAYLRHRLQTLQHEDIVQIRGVGLLVGIEMKTAVAPWIASAREKGLLIINAGENILRLAPPLIASRDEIDEAVAIINESFSE
jgi:acetylornithine/succinyldiaminopimelate/putrescine aminotransferase